MTSIHSLPIELIHQILLESDPLDVSSFSRTSHAFHSIVYDPPNSTTLWRELYLRLHLDDPRDCYDELGNPLFTDKDPANVDWKGRLQRFARARTVTVMPSLCKSGLGERKEVLRALVDMMKELPPSRDEADDRSFTAAYLVTLIVDGDFLNPAIWSDPFDPEERQLRAQLHTYFGLTPHDLIPSSRTTSRGVVYALRNWTHQNFYGPFLKDRSGKVDWELMRHIHLVMSLHLIPSDPKTGLPKVDRRYEVYQMSLPFCQSEIPRGVDLDRVDDWAGVSGDWDCCFCFIDHRELLAYNNYNLSPTYEQLDTSMFDDPNFVEIFRRIRVTFRLVRSEPDPAHPTRPKLFISGGIGASPNQMNGWVALTPDLNVRWHFESGEPGHAVWSSEGIQVGGVRALFGVLGMWSSVEHDNTDPVGPFWMHKVSFNKDDSSSNSSSP